MLTALLAARILDVKGFGEFAIVFLVFVVGQSVPRALVGQPLLIHPKEADEDPGVALGSGIVVGLGVGALIALAGAGTFLSGAQGLGEALMILGVFFPLLVLQDVGRFAGFARRRPVAAMHLDLVWLVLMVVAIGGAEAITELGLPGLVLGWVGAGAAAGLMVPWQNREHRIRISLGWVRTCWTYSWRYLISAVTKQGGVLVGTLFLTAFASVAAVGAIQGATLILRPFATAQIAAVTAGTAEVARDRLQGRNLRRFAFWLSAALTAVAIANAAVLLGLPDSLGKLILGDTWSSAKELAVPAGLSIVVMGAWTGAWAALLGDRSIRKVLVLDLTFTPIWVGMAAIGSAIDGASGYYWGVVAGQLLMTTAGWIWFFLHSRTREPDEPEASAYGVLGVEAEALAEPVAGPSAAP